MKKNVLILLLLTAPLSLFSQTVLMFYNPTYSIVDGKASATFDISLPEEGAYMVYCWIQGVKKSSGGYHSYTLKTVGSGTSSVVVQNSGDWGYSQGSYIFIPYYVTQLRIEGGSMVDVPNVECLAIVSEPMTLSNGYAAMKNHLQHPSSSSGAYASEFHYHDSIGDSSYPPVGFMAKRDKALYYTFQRKEYYLAGQTVTVSVTSSLLSSGSCVVNLFADTEYPTYSWTGNSSLTAQITSSGFYNVMIRGNADGVWGTCDFNINGERYFEDVPVNTSLDVLDDDYPDHNRCCFALCSNGDAASMLLNPVGSVYVYSEDHGLQPSSDFDWGVNPLAIQRMLPGYAHFTTLSNSIPQSNFTAKADVYTGVTYGSSYLLLNPADYPNYKNGDRMISAPASLAYNELAWAFGEWNQPIYLYGSNVVEQLEELDEYFEEKGYTRIGASQNNSVIDVYVNDSVISHLAVKSKGHYYAAGYGWESKLGGHERVFHPRFSLEGGIAGCVSYYYRRKSNNNSFQSTSEGFVWEDATFTDQEWELIHTLSSRLKNEDVLQFGSLMKQCYDDATRRPFVSLCQFRDLEHYEELLAFCMHNPETLSLIIGELPTDFGLSFQLLYDVTAEEYGELKNDIIETGKEKRYSADGQRILRSSRADAILFAKRLINDGVVNDFCNRGAPLTVPSITLWQDGTRVTVVYDLQVTAKVSITYANPMLGSMQTVVGNELMSSGLHTVQTDVHHPGIYVFSVVTDGHSNKKTIIVK